MPPRLKAPSGLPSHASARDRVARSSSVAYTLIGADRSQWCIYAPYSDSQKSSAALQELPKRILLRSLFPIFNSDHPVLAPVRASLLPVSLMERVSIRPSHRACKTSLKPLKISHRPDIFLVGYPCAMERRRQVYLGKAHREDEDERSNDFG